jgi:hypothetical protein
MVINHPHPPFQPQSTMNETPISQTQQNHPPRKPGLFKRMIDKLDQAMKQKADQKTKPCCCSGESDKGKKCC